MIVGWNGALVQCRRNNYAGDSPAFEIILPLIGFLHLGLNLMAFSIEELWGMSEQALVGAYADARRQFVEKKFARDTQRARLEWMRAKAFINGAGGVTERKMAVDVSEELARKGQELREMTRELDLLKADLDVIAMVIRLRGPHALAPVQVDDAAEGEPERDSA
jgi:hypothetical protein